MHGNMVFSTHYILGTPQQSRGFLVCSVHYYLTGEYSPGVEHVILGNDPMLRANNSKI